MGQLIEDTTNINTNNISINTLLRKFALTLIGTEDISQQQACHELLGYPLYTTNNIQFVTCNLPGGRTVVINSNEHDNELKVDAQDDATNLNMNNDSNNMNIDSGNDKEEMDASDESEPESMIESEPESIESENDFEVEDEVEDDGDSDEKCDITRIVTVKKSLEDIYGQRRKLFGDKFINLGLETLSLDDFLKQYAITKNCNYSHSYSRE